MKRRQVHRVFGLLAVLCALPAAWHGYRLWQADHVAAAVDAAVAGAQPAEADAAPEVRFARAGWLVTQGEVDAAVESYKRLARGDRPTLRRAARFNLGNLYLRQALAAGRGRADEMLPLVELAKQSYRDLLREDPDDWDARYNLERALWLQPERSGHGGDDEQHPYVDQRVIRYQGGFRLELP